MFSRELYHPGFWIVSYQQSLVARRIIHKLRGGEVGNSGNGLGFSPLPSLYGIF
jgi:hypothetical protein